MKNKRGSVLIWILIILVLIGIGVGVYFWLTTGNDAGLISSGSSIPQPPALPN